MLIMGCGGRPSTGGGSSYTGPGDLVAFDFWWGLRAYSGAVAASGTAVAAEFTRQNDSHTCDVLIAADGTLGLTTNCSTGGDNGQALTTWQTTVGSAAGAITGTLLTLALNLDLFSQITGSGVAPGTFVVSGGNPNWVVNRTQTVASTTLTAYHGVVCTKLYEQVSGGPAQLPSGAQYQPALVRNNDPSGTMFALAMGGVSQPASGLFATITAPAQPFTMYVVAISDAQNEGIPIGGFFGTGGAGSLVFDRSGSPNNMAFYAAGTDPQVTAADGVWGFFRGTANGASTSVSYNAGTPGTGTGAGTIGTKFGIGAAADHNSFAQHGRWQEGGLKAGTTSGANDTALYGNARTFWGMP